MCAPGEGEFVALAGKHVCDVGANGHYREKRPQVLESQNTRQRARGSIIGYGTRQHTSFFCCCLRKHNPKPIMYDDKLMWIGIRIESSVALLLRTSFAVPSPILQKSSKHGSGRGGSGEQASTLQNRTDNGDELNGGSKNTFVVKDSWMSVVVVGCLVA